MALYELYELFQEDAPSRDSRFELGEALTHLHRRLLHGGIVIAGGGNGELFETGRQQFSPPLRR